MKPSSSWSDYLRFWAWQDCLFEGRTDGKLQHFMQDKMIEPLTMTS